MKRYFKRTVHEPLLKQLGGKWDILKQVSREVIRFEKRVRTDLQCTEVWDRPWSWLAETDMTSHEKLSENITAKNNHTLQSCRSFQGLFLQWWASAWIGSGLTFQSWHQDRRSIEQREVRVGYLGSSLHFLYCTVMGESHRMKHASSGLFRTPSYTLGTTVMYIS